MLDRGWGTMLNGGWGIMLEFFRTNSAQIPLIWVDNSAQNQHSGRIMDENHCDYEQSVMILV